MLFFESTGHGNSVTNGQDGSIKRQVLKGRAVKLVVGIVYINHAAHEDKQTV